MALAVGLTVSAVPWFGMAIAIRCHDMTRHNMTYHSMSWALPRVAVICFMALSWLAAGCHGMPWPCRDLPWYVMALPPKSQIQPSAADQPHSSMPAAWASRKVSVPEAVPEATPEAAPGVVSAAATEAAVRSIALFRLGDCCCVRNALPSVVYVRHKVPLRDRG